MTDTRRVTRSARAETIEGEEEEDLPYRIELWETRNRKVERVLARAARSALARAIFKAAQQEYPDRRITLRRGARLIAEAP
jgi:uncharacterized Zn finger protein